MPNVGSSEVYISIPGPLLVCMYVFVDGSLLIIFS